MNLAGALAYAEQNADRFLDELKQFLSIPSVSARPEHRADVQRAAEFVRDRLVQAGLEATIVEGGRDGLPLVKGQRLGVANAPTVILYGHHDVQPVDPIDLWETPPFEPTLVGGMIRARGGADDKGPTLAQIAGVEAWLKGAGELPVNLIVLVEGEEECGGNVLPDYIRSHRDELRAEHLVVMDCSGYAPGVPALVYGLRGVCTLEVRVDGPSRDLHSGGYGGTVRNPAEALCELIASCRSEDGTIAIPDAVEDALPLSSEERERLSAVPFDQNAFMKDVGAPALWGEAGFSTLERRWARPTFEVNGLFAGYQGEGSKTIVPAWAGAKLSLRLVPGQKPASVMAAAMRHFENRAPSGVRVTVTKGFGALAVSVDPKGPAAEAGRQALKQGFQNEPMLTREGGSVPVVATFVQQLGVTPILLGTYRPGEKAHSPNEQYHPDDFQAAVRTSIALLARLAERYPPINSP